MGLIASGILAGGLLLGTGGLVAAQGQTASPSADPTTSSSPGTMRSSDMGASGMTGSAGMMGQMSPADIQAMAALHQSMGTNGSCDTAQMGQLHGQMHASR